MTSLSPEDQAIRLTCATHFHQALWLPQTANRAKLRVTYSTTTNFDNVSLPAILFIGPMFGTRWMALHFDKLARDCGVRVICVDRPAFGGSTSVAIDLRMRTWLETVPALLRRLDVEHVAMVTHSAGTLYTLNTLFHHRSLLDPKAPYVAFLAPWVPTANSGATLATLAAKLPTPLLDSWAGLNTFINTKILPSASWSGGIISSSAALLSSSAGTDVPGAEGSTSTTPFEQYGFDDDTANLIKKLSSKYQFAESNTGANEEIKLCLRRCNDADWGEAADYLGCIRKIAVNEAARGQGEPNAARLNVEAFFAGSDIMIAKRGQKYFEQCWQSDEVKEKVNFTTSTFPAADHDSLLIDQKKGALKVVFKRIAQLGKEL
ncbi:hypothetical protein A1O3_07863 [Capronia epimyces CBS 606.96]|uniref:AB hydrolase-1 domain-containing protein n=1 Tax=Capronia epimyces CBS 606.96 TaxID=1182542 RepID=W9YB31_9EURO|nr:uncharacterized protein A1O3_07863 [Capronia epimyces CBS 606.96]EXJ79584.1 hypothetical protein A1O3_07863 [Capronia epimyces CBS 606.96]